MHLNHLLADLVKVEVVEEAIAGVVEEVVEVEEVAEEEEGLQVVEVDISLVEEEVSNLLIMLLHYQVESNLH